MKLRCITEQVGTATGGNQLAGDQAQRSPVNAGAGTSVPGNPVTGSAGTGDNPSGDTGPDIGTAAPDVRMGVDQPPPVDNLIVEPAHSYFLRRLNSRLRERGLQEQLDLARAIALIEDLPNSIRHRVQRRIRDKTARKPRVPSPELKLPQHHANTHTESDNKDISGTNSLVTQSNLGAVGSLYTSPITPGLNDLDRRNNGAPDYRVPDPDQDEGDDDAMDDSIDDYSPGCWHPDASGTTVADIIDYIGTTISKIGSVIGSTTTSAVGRPADNLDSDEGREPDAISVTDLPSAKRRNTDPDTAMEVDPADLPDDRFDEAILADEYMDILLEAMT